MRNIFLFFAATGSLIGALGEYGFIEINQGTVWNVVAIILWTYIITDPNKK